MEESISQYIKQYTKQLESGNVQKGYRALIEYLMSLRTYFQSKYSSELIVGSFYQGYMDMSYFPITTTFLKKRKLKVGIVFNHEKIRFELWLLGQNKQVQKECWDLIKSQNWKKYRISETGKDGILTHYIAEKPNFSQLEMITEKIDIETLKFIEDVKSGLK